MVAWNSALSLCKPLVSFHLVEFNQYLVFVDVSLILSGPLRTAVHSLEKKGINGYRERHKLMEKVINKK